jgi:hypothetical protein
MLKVNNFSAAADQFELGWRRFVTPPFNIFAECAPPGCYDERGKNPTGFHPPCANFLTGAGGFLQSLVYGHGTLCLPGIQRP